MANLQDKSKYLSFLLRHKPEAAKLTLDKEGWCYIPELLANTQFTLEELEEIVSTDKKGRYSLRYFEMGGDGLPFTKEPTHIRANQGHSTNYVDLSFDKKTPPNVLYHGTNVSAFVSIIRQGLQPMSRQYVHLSADRATAESVAGRRKNDSIILLVDAKTMIADGFTFFLSTNNVWLISAVPYKYITQEHKND